MEKAQTYVGGEEVGGLRTPEHQALFETAEYQAALERAVMRATDRMVVEMTIKENWVP